jgi:small subunit ribosomal protein S3
VGQKVSPIGFRIGVIRDWDARWYAGRNYTDLLHEDLRIRKIVAEHLRNAAVSRVEIERVATRVRISVHTAKPGVVIGKGGAGVDELRRKLENATQKQVHINIIEIKAPELDAYLVAEGIAAQLAKRVTFRRAMKQAVTRTIRSGAKGVKVMVSGRLGGAEIARTEVYHEGTVPLQTLRANIDYGFVEAHTTYGRIGVKVWIYKGEVLPTRQKNKEGGTRDAHPEKS